MIQSAKPRYQRRFRYTAPLHMRQHFAHAHLDKALRTKLKIKSRAVQISKGDTVKIMVGNKRGTSGKVIEVNLRTGRILIDSFMRKNARGKERPVPISASNVYITELNLTDKVRAAKLKVAVVEKKEKEQAAKPAAAGAVVPAKTAGAITEQKSELPMVEKQQKTAIQQTNK